MGGAGNCLTYPHALSIARVLMPPSRTSRNFGVGRAVYGISEVDVPMGGYTPFWWVAPHITAVRPIGVNGWGGVRAQDRNIGSK